MHAFLVVGGGDEAKKTEADKISLKNSATLVTYPIQKIDEVRRLKKFLKLNPQMTTALYLPNIDTATQDAANSLLKHIEEKDNFIFVFTASNLSRVLPTIVSRCQLIKTKSALTVSEDYSDFFDLDTKSRFELVTKIKTRGEALEFLDELLTTGYNQFLEKNEIELYLENTLMAKKMLSANTNVFLQLTNYIISLDGITPKKV